MTPLSWHTYAGNVDIVQLLLDNGARINTEFDLLVPNSSKSVIQVTATDIAFRLLPDRSTSTGKTKDESMVDDEEEGDDKHVKTYGLLVSRGGKKFEELTHVMDDTNRKTNNLEL